MLCQRAETNVLFIDVVGVPPDPSGIVSAVRRLLRGDQKAKFMKSAKDYRDSVEAMRSEYPPWVAGKLRAVMANLHVV